jgi:ssDNA-binding Zn-finger/Zn-ribbon topoisomerase 1
MLSPEQIAALNEDLDAGVVSTRSQGGKDLSYVEAHYCIRRANEIFGFGGWRRRTLSNELISFEDDVTKTDRDGNQIMRNGEPVVGWRVAYLAHVEVAVSIGDEWVATTGTGFGESTSYISPGQAHENAAKEAESDAMKRALICWGDQFGLALYDKAQAHVEGTVARGSGGSRPSSGGGGNGGGNGGGGPCPDCGRTMTLRTRRDGSSSFWGCPGYPSCRRTFNAGAAPWEAEIAAAVPEAVRIAEGEEDPFGDTAPSSTAAPMISSEAQMKREASRMGVGSKEEYEGLFAAVCETLWGGVPAQLTTLTPQHWGEVYEAMKKRVAERVT